MIGNALSSLFKRRDAATLAENRHAAQAEKAQVIRKGYAVLLNNTAARYHWGCYGTSTAIYEGLIEAGYAVLSFDVEATHASFGEAPVEASDEAIAAFGMRLQSVNPMAFRALRDSDLVVVNGEGTLHRFHQGPRALLSMVKLAASMGRKVHVVNYSCFPSGNRGLAAPEIEAFYTTCLGAAHRLVVRDPWSAAILDRMGLKTVLGFDCLPAFIEDLPGFPTVERAIVIGAANWWDEAIAERVAKEYAAIFVDDRSPLIFLSGGYKHSPPEDAFHFSVMQRHLPQLRMVTAGSVMEWVSWIRSAELLVTGRFHHVIAAAALSTPFVSSRGNTVKTEALTAMLGAGDCLDPARETFPEELRAAISKPFKTSAEQAADIVMKARANIQFD